MINERFWIIAYFLLFFLLSLATVKINIGITFRIVQLYIVILFLIIIMEDIIKRTINIKLLFFFFIFGISLSLISINSTYHKIGEFKFIIKYLSIFPFAFYIGSKLPEKVSVKNIIKILELDVLIVVLFAIYLYYYPIPSLIHDRGPLTGFQGTFWESGGLGGYIALFFLSSLLLRLQYNIWPKNKYLLYIFYIFLLGNIIATKKKAALLGLTTIGISFVFYKIYLLIKLNKHIYLRYNFLYKILNYINLKKTLSILTIGIIIFFIINSSLEKPIISWEILQHKWESERGKAFRVAMSLLEQSNWLGGYGWGFVESYFSTYNLGIIGLGEGVSMMFNSYIDIWLSVGILGLLFSFILLAISFSTLNLYSAFVPLYLFIIANLNPIGGSETYFLFLGISYGIKNIIKKYY